MRRFLAIVLGVMVAGGVALGGPAPAAANHEIVIGLQCDRTGATQTVGVNLCPGYHDYVDLVNSKGGIAGPGQVASREDRPPAAPPP